MKEQLIMQCQNILTKYQLTTLYIASIILYLIAGLIFVKESKTKLLWIIFVGAVLTGIVYALLYFMPITFSKLLK